MWPYPQRGGDMSFLPVSLPLLCLSLVPLAVRGEDASPLNNALTVHGFFSRSPECCENVCAAPGETDPTKSKCFID
jgi:hypothetical protein